MKTTGEIHAYLSSLGKLGGASKSDAKIAAVRENGKKGGRPKKDHSEKGNTMKTKNCETLNNQGAYIIQKYNSDLGEWESDSGVMSYLDAKAELDQKRGWAKDDKSGAKYRMQLGKITPV